MLQARAVKNPTYAQAASALAGVALALLASGPGFAQQPTAGATTTIDRKAVAKEADQDANKFKTREQRLQAKPLDWNSTIGKPTAPAAPAEGATQGQPGTSSGGAANPKADSDARRQFPNEWRSAPQPGKRSFLDFLDLGPAEDRVQLTAGSPDIYTEYNENSPSVNPNAPTAIGKLFTNAGTCSASVVSGNNVIVTAAHCCWNRGTNNWIGGWSFAPAYNNGNTPYGTFPWSSATVLNSWINNGDTPSDVCTIKLANNNAGKSVTYYTGWLGRSWNFPSDQEHHALGYPGNLGGGQVLQACTSESFSPSNACGGTAILNTGCSMTYGSSGGPWVRAYRTNNWVNSVVHGYDSQTCTGTFGQTFNGARFTSGNIVPVCNAAGC
jgi:V8-like Glu-specific endopeptidase